MIRAARVDRNQPEIVKALRIAGATVVITSQLKNFCDIVVGFRGKLFLMEIKDHLKPPSQRNLTIGELKCKQDFERVDVPYLVINTIEQALTFIGAI